MRLLKFPKIPFPKLSKRQKFVIAVLLLTLCLFISEFFTGYNLIIFAFVLSFLTIILLYSILFHDIKKTFFYPLFILPFLYTFSFDLFYTLVPQRLYARIILTALYAFGLYSLFLTQNIFAVSGVKTINLLRSARIVAFIITIFVLFFLVNFIFSFHLPIYFVPIPIFLVSFVLNFQSLWSYTLEKKYLKEISVFSLFTSVAISQLSMILIIWPVNAAIYSIFLAGIFYMYSGLSHAWFDKRLFKGVLWEYVWVGLISMLVLISFSKWGI